MRQEGPDLYRVFRSVLRPAVKTFWKPTVIGLEHIPRGGPALLAANHISVLDSVFMIPTLPRRITYIGKAEYLDSWKTKYFFEGLGAIPVDRSGGDAAAAALEAAVRVLEAGGLFGIFPEGTRTRDGFLHRGKTGVARLAMRTGAPIIPMGLRGLDEIQPPDAKFPRPFRHWEVRIGKPLYPARYGNDPNDNLALRALTDETMYEISQLSGQTYVNTYSEKGAQRADAA
jgi:1-acyl-sn-glycerol-3-phosphate acyltransferase